MFRHSELDEVYFISSSACWLSWEWEVKYSRIAFSLSSWWFTPQQSEQSTSVSAVCWTKTWKIIRESWGWFHRETTNVVDLKPITQQLPKSRTTVLFKVNRGHFSQNRAPKCSFEFLNRIKLLKHFTLPWLSFVSPLWMSRCSTHTLPPASLLLWQLAGLI